MDGAQLQAARRLGFGTRLLISVSVAATTYVGWLIAYALSGIAIAFASIFQRHRLTPAERFGEVWRWVVPTTALVLIVTLLRGSRWARVSGFVWFAAMAVMALDAILQPGEYEPATAPALPLVVAGALTLWIFLAAPRAA
jgi:thiamine transporter ThiT